MNEDLLKLKIKGSGVKLTNSRKNILSILSKANKGLTPEEIFILAHKKDSSIGIATVYRTLSLFEKIKIIEKSYNNVGKAIYILKAKEVPSENIEKYPQDNLQAAFTDKTIKNQEHKNLYFNYIKGTEGFYHSEKTVSYLNAEKINEIQAQLNRWAIELNKIKREKEINLEELINDFGRIDKILEKHQLSKNNLIQMLIDFQTEYNWLPKHVLFYVSSKLNVTLSQIYSIASFYKFFNLEPRGKYQIIVCAGTACHVRGSMNLLQRIVNVLKIKPGDTTSDYKFTLDTVNCLGCCALGPVMLFNNKYYSNPSTKELEKLFSTVT